MYRKPNVNHNYETVLPNFKKPTENKVQQAQQYEVPLSQSATLTHSFTTGSHNETGDSFRLQILEEERPRVKAREPIYMNARTSAKIGKTAVSTQRSQEYDILSPVHLQEHNNCFGNRDCEEDREIRLITSSESWAI